MSAPAHTMPVALAEALASAQFYAGARSLGVLAGVGVATIVLLIVLVIFRDDGSLEHGRPTASETAGSNFLDTPSVGPCVRRAERAWSGSYSKPDADATTAQGR